MTRRLWLQGGEGSCGRLRSRIILVLHDFTLAGAKRIRRNWLDVYTASGAGGGSRGWLPQRWRAATETTVLRVLRR